MRLRTGLVLIGPGLLVAATGVGAGDLATAALAGHRLGVAILWAVLAGAFLKFVLNEGLARFQLATGETLLEGALRRFGPLVRILFLGYFLIWSFFVGAALMGACGVALHAVIPVFDDAATGKVVFGIVASAAGFVLARIGGYKLFERIMSVCIALMLVTVVVTAVIICEDWGATLRGLFVPRIPGGSADAVSWTVALIGGVGGTLTVLCYGYWIREEGRRGPSSLRACRIDLAVGYSVTALFGVAMVIIGSTVAIDGKGAGLVVAIADRLEEPLGLAGRWAFLLGAFGAVFSSLLGVWQAVPYLFADFRRITSGKTDAADLAATSSYRIYAIALAVVPALGLFSTFARAQKVYAIVGALFMPALALALIVLNRRSIVGACADRPMTKGALGLVLVLFGWLAWRSLS